MSIYLADSSDFTAVADAIRTKGGTSATLTWPQGYVDAVDQLSTSLPTYDGTVETANNNAYLKFTIVGYCMMRGPNGSKTWDGLVEYSLDGINWTTWNAEQITVSSPGGEIYLRGTGNSVFTKNSNLQLNGNTSTKIYAEGSIMALLDYKMVAAGIDPVMSENAFSAMFSGNSTLYKAPDLPSTHLAKGCYFMMFTNCTNLEVAPTLPATVLADSCYQQMFNGCTGLTEAPALPATRLAQSCYNYMFLGCTALKLSTTQEGEYQYEYRIPKSGEGTTTTNSLNGMFTSTGGTFNGTPTINTTYYTTNPPVE